MDRPRLEAWPSAIIPSPLAGGAQGRSSPQWTFATRQSPLSDFTKAVDLSAEFPRGLGKALVSDEVTSGVRDVTYPALDQSPSPLKLRRHWEGAAEQLGASAQKAAGATPESTSTPAPFSSTTPVTPAELQQQLRDEAEAILSDFRQALSHSMSLHNSSRRLSLGGSSTAGSYASRFRDAAAALGLGALYASPGEEANGGASDLDEVDWAAEAAKAAAAVLSRAGAGGHPKGPQRQLRWDGEATGEGHHSSGFMSGDGMQEGRASSPGEPASAGHTPQSSASGASEHAMEGDNGAGPAPEGLQHKAMWPQHQQRHSPHVDENGAFRLVDYSPSTMTGHVYYAPDGNAGTPGTSSANLHLGRPGVVAGSRISWRDAIAGHMYHTTPTSSLSQYAPVGGLSSPAPPSPLAPSGTPGWGGRHLSQGRYEASTPQSVAASNGGGDDGMLRNSPQQGISSASGYGWRYASSPTVATGGAAGPGALAGHGLYQERAAASTLGGLNAYPSPSQEGPGSARSGSAANAYGVPEHPDLSALLDSPYAPSTAFPTPSYVSRAYHPAGTPGNANREGGTEDAFGPPRFGSGEDAEGLGGFSDFFASGETGDAAVDVGISGPALQHDQAEGGGYFGASPLPSKQVLDATVALESSGANLDYGEADEQEADFDSPPERKAAAADSSAVSPATPGVVKGVGESGPQSSAESRDAAHSDDGVPTFSERPPLRSRRRTPAQPLTDANPEDDGFPFAYGARGQSQLVPCSPSTLTGAPLTATTTASTAQHALPSPQSVKGHNTALSRLTDQGEGEPAGAMRPYEHPHRSGSHAGTSPVETPGPQVDTSAAPGGRTAHHVLSHELSWASETERELAGELSRAWDAAGSVSRRHTRSVPGDQPSTQHQRNQPIVQPGSAASSGAPGSAFSFGRLSGPGCASSGAGSAALSDLRTRMSQPGAAPGSTAGPSEGSGTSALTGGYDGCTYSSGGSSAGGRGVSGVESARRRLDETLDALAEPPLRLAASAVTWQIQENPAFEENPDVDEALSTSTVGQEAPQCSGSSSPAGYGPGPSSGPTPGSTAHLTREERSASPYRALIARGPLNAAAAPSSGSASSSSSKAPSGTGMTACSSDSDSPRTSALNRLMGSGISPSVRQLQGQLGLLPRDSGDGCGDSERSDGCDSRGDTATSSALTSSGLGITGPGTGRASVATMIVDPEVRTLVLELEHAQAQLAHALALGRDGVTATPQSLPMLAAPMPSATDGGPGAASASATRTPVSGVSADVTTAGDVAAGGWLGSATPVSGVVVGAAGGSRAAQVAAAAVSKALARVVKMSRENHGLQRLNEQLSGELSRAGTAQLELQARNKLLYAMLEERSRQAEQQARSDQRRLLRLEAQLEAAQQRSRQLERAHTQVSLEGQQAARQLEAAQVQAAEAAAAADALRAQVEALEAQLQASAQEEERKAAAEKATARKGHAKVKQLEASLAESAAELRRTQTSLQTAQQGLAQHAAEAEAAHRAAEVEAARAQQLKEQLRSAQTAADDLAARLRDAEEVAFSQEEQLEAARIAMAELTAERAAARAEMVRWEDAARNARSEAEEARRGAEAEASNATAARAEVRELQEQLEVVQAEAEVAAAELRQQLEAAAWEAEQRGAEAAEAAQRAADAEAREAGLREELQAAAADRERAWRQLEDTQRAHARLQEELVRNDNVAMDLLQQAEEASNGVAEQTARAEQLQRRLDAQAVAAAAAAEAHASALTSLRAEQARLRDAYERAQQQLQQLAAQLEATRQELADRERERDELAAAHAALVEAAGGEAAALSAAHEQLHALRDQLAEAHARAAQQDVGQRSLRERLGVAEESIADLKQARGSLESELRQARAEAAAAQAQAGETVAESARTERDRAAADERARRLEEELGHARELLAEALSAQAEAEERAVEANAALKEARRLLTASEEAFQQQLATAHETKSALEQELEQQADANECIRLDAARLQDQLLDLREARARLQDELDNTAAELSAARACLAEREAELFAAQSELDNAREEHQQALAGALQHAADAEALAAACEAELADARAAAQEVTRASAAEARRAAAEAEAADARAAAEAEARRADEAEVRCIAAEARAAEARAAADTEARRATDLDAEMEVAARRLVELQSRLEAATAELAEARAGAAAANRLGAAQSTSAATTPDNAAASQRDRELERTPSGAGVSAARRLNLTVEVHGEQQDEEYERLLLRSAAEVAAATPDASPTAAPSPSDGSGSRSRGARAHRHSVGTDAETPSGRQQPRRGDFRSEGGGASPPTSEPQSPSLQLAGEVVAAHAQLADLRRRHADAEELIALMGQQLSEARAHAGDLEQQEQRRAGEAAATRARVGELERQLEQRGRELVDARSAAELAALRLPGTAWDQRQTHGSLPQRGEAAESEGPRSTARRSPAAAFRTECGEGGAGGLEARTPFSLWGQPGSVAQGTGRACSPLPGTAYPYAGFGSPAASASRLRSSAARSPDAATLRSVHSHASPSPLPRELQPPLRLRRASSPCPSSPSAATIGALRAGLATVSGDACGGGDAAPAAAGGTRDRGSSGGSGAVAVSVQLLELRYAVQRVEQAAEELAAVLLGAGSRAGDGAHSATTAWTTPSKTNNNTGMGDGAEGLLASSRRRTSAGAAAPGLGGLLGDSAAQAVAEERAWLADSLVALTRRAGALAGQLGACLDAAVAMQARARQASSPARVGLTPLAVRRLEAELAGLRAQFEEAQRQAEAALEQQAVQHASEMSDLASDASTYRALVERLRGQLLAMEGALRAEREQRAEREAEERLHTQSLQRVCQQLAAKSARQEDTIARLKAQLQAEQNHAHGQDLERERWSLSAACTDVPVSDAGAAQLAGAAPPSCRQYRVSSPPSDLMTHGSASPGAQPCHDADGSRQGSCGSRGGDVSTRTNAGVSHSSGGRGVGANSGGTEMRAPSSPSPSDGTVGEPCSSPSSSTPPGSAMAPAHGHDADSSARRASEAGGPAGHEPTRHGGAEAARGGGPGSGGAGGSGGVSEVEERLWRELAQVLTATSSSREGGGSRNGSGSARATSADSLAIVPAGGGASAGRGASASNALVLAPAPSAAGSHQSQLSQINAGALVAVNSNGIGIGTELVLAAPTNASSAGGRAALLARAVSQVAVLDQQNRKLVKLLAKVCGRSGGAAEGGAGMGDSGALALAAALESLRRDNRALATKYAAAQLAQQQSGLALQRLGRENRELHEQLQRQVRARIQDLSASLAASAGAAGHGGGAGAGVGVGVDREVLEDSYV